MNILPPYKFCAVCGSDLKTERREDRDLLICSSCAHVHYVNSAPTANGVILNEAGELLLAQRGIEPAKGTWDFAGGFLQNGEDPRVGLRREIDEELGVDCEVGDFVAVHVSCFPDVYRECTFNTYWEVHLKSLDVSANDDVVDVRWWKLDEIRPEDMPYDGAWNVVEQIKSRR